MIVYIQLHKRSQAYHCLGLRLSRSRTKMLHHRHRYRRTAPFQQHRCCLMHKPTLNWKPGTVWVRTTDICFHAELSKHQVEIISATWDYICNNCSVMNNGRRKNCDNDFWEQRRRIKHNVYHIATYLNMNVTRLSGILWDTQEISITLIVFHLSLGTLRGSVFFAPIDILFRDISYFGQI